ncbi:uncharacterized protein TNCV_812121 [Trichonephila clavipes]|nr:uncharacterized protein TNCV_812121 [Trichonephila clavipes]
MELLCESHTCHESYGSVFSSFQEEAKNSDDINSKLVSSFLSIGRGHAALETFSSVLNMPTMDRKTFAKCMHNLSVKNKKVKKQMLEMSRQAAREAHVKVEASDNKIYGSDIKIKREECLNHIAKRLDILLIYFRYY